MTIDELKELQKLLEKAAREAWEVYEDAFYHLKNFKAQNAAEVYEALDNAATKLALKKGYIAKEENK